MRWKLKLRSDYRARAAWEAGLAWYRLRYRDAAGPERAIALLSRPQAAGRVALFYAPAAEVSRLYVGVPQSHAPALQRVARDFAFTIRAAVAAVAPPAMLMVPASELPWERAFVAHIVDGHAFVGKPEGSGPFLPQPGAADSRGWQLLQIPPAGLRAQPSWNGHLSPAGHQSNRPGHEGHVRDGRMGGDHLCGEGEDRIWPLGWGADGTPAHAGGPVNLYGRQEAVTAWLVGLVSHLLATDPGSLIVIDGAGDLVPALKRKSVVTCRLGRELTYVDIAGAPVAGGFNPLAPVLGEKPADTLRRWQRWFAALQVHPAGLQLLAEAGQAGVRDIPELQQWLQQPAQQHRPAAAGTLQAALIHLLRDPHAREWLSWPTNIFAGLPAGILLFSCPGSGWSRRLLRQAAVLAARRVPEARVILHGLSWKENGPTDLDGNDRLLIANGPLQPSATVALTGSHPQGAAGLARRFFQGSLQWQENLELLPLGESVVLGAEGPIVTTLLPPGVRNNTTIT